MSDIGNIDADCSVAMTQFVKSEVMLCTAAAIDNMLSRSRSYFTSLRIF